MKTTKKILAIFLSVLMVTLALPFAAGAEFGAPEGYTQIPTADSDALSSGDYWFDMDAFAEREIEYGLIGNDEPIEEAVVYLEDSFTDIIVVFLNSGDHEYSLDENDPRSALPFLHQHSNFPGFTLLSTADSNDLDDGDLWFDMGGFIQLDLSVFEEGSDEWNEAYAVYSAAQVYLSNDQQTIKLVSSDAVISDLTADEQPAAFDFLRQHIGTEEHFTQLPTADSNGLADGAYWFDLNGMMELELAGLAPESAEYANAVALYSSANVYLHEGGDLLRAIGDGLYVDIARTDNSGETWFGFLHQHMGTAEHFALLPTADSDALNDGDYWFDKNGMMEAELELAGYAPESEAYANAVALYNSMSVYLHEDGDLLRVIADGLYNNIDRNDNSGDFWFGFLHQHIDLTGFTLLPTVDSDDLDDGAYWFDLNAFIAYDLSVFEEGSDEWNEAYAVYSAAQVYLSDDHQTIRLISSEASISDLTADMFPTAFDFLHQHVGTAEHFTLLPTVESNSLADGAYWFDLNGMMELELAGLDPESAAYANAVALYSSANVYLHEGGDILRAIGDGLYVDIARTDNSGETWFGFLHQHVGTAEHFTQLPPADSNSLLDGQNYFDLDLFLAILLSGLNDQAQITQYRELYENADFYLSTDGNTFRIISSTGLIDFAKDSETGSEYFNFIHPHGYYTVLPHADSDALSDGDYWIDTDALATAEHEAPASYLNIEFAYNAENEQLRISLGDGSVALYEKGGSQDLDVLFDYILPHGYFTLLPTADGNELAEGAYYLDLAGLAEAEGVDPAQFADYVFMINADASILRADMAENGVLYLTPDASADVFAFLHQHVDLYAGFNQLPTADSDSLAYGDYWYDVNNMKMIELSAIDPESEAYAAANAVYDGAQFYLSEDGNTLRVFFGNSHVDYSRDADPVWFLFLYQHGIDPNAGFNPIALSDSDALSDGDYWFDAEVLKSDVIKGLSTSDDNYDASLRSIMYFYSHMTAYLSEDGTTLRLNRFTEINDIALSSTDADDLYLLSFLHPHGYFTVLPHADSDALNDGDYWFDAAAVVPTEPAFENAEIAVNPDGSLIRLSLPEEGASYFAVGDNASGDELNTFIHPHGYFTVLPHADSDALNDGDYWFDAPAVATLVPAYENAEVSVSTDGSLIRLSLPAEGASYFAVGDNASGDELNTFIHPHGYFTVLPHADSDALNDGDYWFDAAAVATIEPAFENAEISVNADGSLIRLSLPGEGVLYYAVGDNGSGDELNAYIHPHGYFTVLPHADSDALNDGDYWFDTLGIRIMILKEDPDISSDELEEYVNAYDSVEYSITADGNTLRLSFPAGNPLTEGVMYLTRGQAGGDAEFFFSFIHPHGYFKALPTADSDSLNEGDLWIDLDAFVAVMPNETMAALFANGQYLITADGNTLRIIADGDSTEVTRDEEASFFKFIFPHGTTFVKVPTADSDSLGANDKWFDLQGFIWSLIGSLDDSADDYQERYDEILDVYSKMVVYYDTVSGAIRLCTNVACVDIAADDQTNNAVFYRKYLRPHGFFVPLPKADSAELTDDQYFFEFERFFAALTSGATPEEIEEYRAIYENAPFYLSTDGNTFRIVLASRVFDVEKGAGESADVYFSFILQHGYFIALPTADSDELNDGDYWYDHDGLLSFMLATAESEEDRAEITAMFAGAEYYISRDGAFLRASLEDLLLIPTDSQDQNYQIYLVFLRVHGVDPNEGYTLLPYSDDELALDEYWFDIEAFLTEEGMTEEELEGYGVSFYIKNDGTILRLVQFGGAINEDIDPEDEYTGCWYSFLKKNHIDSDGNFFCDGCDEYLGIVIENDDTGTAVLAQPEVLDEGVELVVVPDVSIENSSSIVIADGEMTLDSVDYVAYEITLEDEEGNPVQPEGNVIVKIPLPEGYNERTVKVYYIDGEGNATDMEAEVRDGYIYFVTNHFSIYLLVDEPCLHSETELRGVIEANCHTEGYTGDTWCTICGNKIADGTNTGKDMSKHDGEREIRGVVEANCHTEGYTGDTYCLGCDNKIADGENTGKDMSKHDGETEVRGVVEANCHTEGYTGDTYCLGCDNKIADGENTGKDMTKHDGATEIRDSVEANCHTEGYTGDTYCVGCGNKIAGGENTGKDMTRHDALRDVDETESSCTVPGYTAGVYCDSCGNWVSGHEEKALVAHTLGSWTEEVAADCTTAGVRGHYTCTVCNHYFDADEVQLDSITIPAKGHTWSEWETVKEATETETGEKTRTCSVCGETETETIPVKEKPLSFLDNLALFIQKIIAFFRNMIEVFKSIGK